MTVTTMLAVKPKKRPTSVKHIPEPNMMPEKATTNFKSKGKPRRSAVTTKKNKKAAVITEPKQRIVTSY
jgi:hypothetical protein